eukprot:scaffold20.g7763.t1
MRSGSTRRPFANWRVGAIAIALLHAALLATADEGGSSINGVRRKLAAVSVQDALDCNALAGVAACNASAAPACAWLAEDAPFQPPDLLSAQFAALVGSLVLPDGFSFASAGTACAAALQTGDTSTCAPSCASYLTNVSSDVMQATAAAFCGLQTCAPTGDCFQGPDDWAAKRMFSSLFSSCLPGITFPSCFGDAGGCVLADGDCGWYAYCGRDYSKSQVCYTLPKEACAAEAECAWADYAPSGSGSPSPSPGYWSSPSPGPGGVQWSGSPNPGPGGSIGWSPSPGGSVSRSPGPAPGPASGPGPGAWPWPGSPNPGGGNGGPPPSGFGLFALLNPWTASELLRMDAAPVLCDALGGALGALAQGQGDPCAAAGACPAANFQLRQAWAALLPTELQDVAPCPACRALLGGSPAPPFAQALAGLHATLPTGFGGLCTLLGQGSNCAAQLEAVWAVLGSVTGGDTTPGALGACSQQLLQAVANHPWQLQLPFNFSEFAGFNSSGTWWDNPMRHGHGLRDVITPPVAQSLAAAGAGAAICDSLTAALEVAQPSVDQTGPQGFCQASGLCVPDSNITQLLAAAGLDPQQGEISPCDLCHAAIEDGALPQLLGLLGPLGFADSTRGPCPGTMAPLLQLLSSEEPSLPSGAVEGVACPAVQALMDEPTTQSVLLGLDAQALCTALHACGPDAASCTCTTLLGQTLAVLSANPLQAGELCQALLPGLLEQGDSQSQPGPGPAPAPAPPGAQLLDPAQFSVPLRRLQAVSSSPSPGSSPSPSVSAPSPGYCYWQPSWGGSTGAQQPECQMLSGHDACQQAGCAWNQQCYSAGQCSPSDEYCLRTKPYRPVCKSLIGAFIGRDDATTTAHAVPSAPQLCTSLGACAAGNASASCRMCVEAVGQLYTYLQLLPRPGQAGGNYQPWSDAIYRCLDTLDHVSSANTMCSQVVAMLPPSFSDAAALCAQHASQLCDAREEYNATDGSVVRRTDCSGCVGYLGVYKARSRGARRESSRRLSLQGRCPLREFCLQANLVSSPQELGMQLSFKLGCNPTDNKCCRPLSDASFLFQLGLRGLLPGSADCSAMPGCTAQQCYVDNSLQCDTADACCLQPAELLAANASATCAARTGSSPCALTNQCISRTPTCTAYAAAQACNAAANCVWRLDARDPLAPSWCMATADACAQYTNMPEACRAQASCRVVPRCAASGCPQDDACCSIQGTAACSVTAGCQAVGRCNLVYSECWDMGAAACGNTAACTWQGAEAGGRCTPAVDPCSSKPDAASCAFVKNSAGDRICRFASACEQKCKACSECNGAVIGLQQIIAALGNDTSSYATAAWQYCNQTNSEPDVCQQVREIVQKQPVLATRPAALCKALGRCSSDCMASLGLDVCAGAPTKPTTSASACLASSNCPAGASPPQDCSAAYNSTCAATLEYCDPRTGGTASVCVGTCQDRCLLRQAAIAKSNQGRCNSTSDCSGGLTCQPVAGKTCFWDVCANGTVARQPCTGWCQQPLAVNETRPGPALVSAQLSGDGRQVTLAFSQDVSLPAGAQPRSVFSNATAAKLGPKSTLAASTAAPNALLLQLDLQSSLAVGDTLFLLPSSGVVATLTRAAAQASNATLQAPVSPVAPEPRIEGPNAIAPSCSNATRPLVLDGSKTPASAGRPLTSLTWAVSGPANVALAAAVGAATGPKLVVPADVVASMAAGDYNFTLTAGNWLGVNATSLPFAITKQPDVLPDVRIVRSLNQDFKIADGIKLTAAINESTVCAGSSMMYAWTEVTAPTPLLTAPFVANRAKLDVRGPLTGLPDGAPLRLRLNATLAGRGSAVVEVALTARASPVEARLRGPGGDVMETANLTFTWECTKYDPATELDSLCFPDAIPAEGGLLTVPAGTFQPGLQYTVTVTASKGARSDSASRTVTVQAGALPTGTITRACGMACKRAAAPTQDLKLRFALDDPSLRPSITSYAWSSPDVSLAGLATSGPTLVVPAALLSDGTTPTFSINVARGAASAVATIAVPVGRRPACAAAPCLTVARAAGNASSALELAAQGFVADEELLYSWGTVSAGGRRDTWAPGSQQTSYTFAAGALPPGNHTLFVCARGADTGASACAQDDVTVAAPAAPAPVSAEDTARAQEALDTAIASGSSDALVAAVRALTTVASSAGSNATAQNASVVAQISQQTTSAIDALHAVASSAEVTGSSADALAVINTLDALTSSTASSGALTPEAADQSLDIARKTAAALGASGAQVEPEDLDSLINVVANAAAATGRSGSGGGVSRRLLDAGSIDAAAAAQALASIGSVLSDAQTLILANKLPGEPASSMGTTGTLTAAVAVAETASASATNLTVGDTGAALAFAPGLAAACAAAANATQLACPATFDVRLAWSTDPSLLLAVFTTSFAEAPPAGRRRLAAAPEVAGASNTTVVSGTFNFTSGLNGLGATNAGVVSIELPLEPVLYDPAQTAMCLRLDAGGAWRSDSIALAGISGASPPVATCTLSTLDDNQVLVVTYSVPEGGAGPVDSPPPPPPSPPPSPPPRPPPPAEQEVTLPTVTFTAHITTYASPAAFDQAAQEQYAATIQASISGVGAQVEISDIRAGSVIVDTLVLFLVSNGNTEAAAQFLAQLQSDPASVFPPATYGTVGIASATQGSETLLIDPALLTAPAPSSDDGGPNVAAIVGGTVGGTLGALLLVGLNVAWNPGGQP